MLYSHKSVIANRYATRYTLLIHSELHPITNSKTTSMHHWRLSLFRPPVSGDDHSFPNLRPLRIPSPHRVKLKCDTTNRQLWNGKNSCRISRASTEETSKPKESKRKSEVKLPQYYFNSFKPDLSMAERDMRHEKRARKIDLLAGSRWVSSSQPILHQNWTWLITGSSSIFASQAIFSSSFFDKRHSTPARPSTMKGSISSQDVPSIHHLCHK